MGKKILTSLWPLRVEQGLGGKSQGQTGIRNSEELSHRQSCPKPEWVVSSLTRASQAETNAHSDGVYTKGGSS